MFSRENQYILFVRFVSYSMRSKYSLNASQNVPRHYPGLRPVESRVITTARSWHSNCCFPVGVAVLHLNDSILWPLDLKNERFVYETVFYCYTHELLMVLLSIETETFFLISTAYLYRRTSTRGINGKWESVERKRYSFL